KKTVYFDLHHGQHPLDLNIPLDVYLIRMFLNYLIAIYNITPKYYYARGCYKRGLVFRTYPQIYMIGSLSLGYLDIKVLIPEFLKYMTYVERKNLNLPRYLTLMS
ncbi:hypothetical protein ACJX0J_025601, partial [Zea mays]